MHKYYCTLLVAFIITPSLWAGEASGSYKEGEGEFKIAYALADRDAESGEVRILLAGQEPQLANRDHHLDRLEAIGGAAPGGYLEVIPNSSGDGFNITVRADDVGFGGGGQYPGEISVGPDKVTGKIDAEVMSGHLKVTFEAGFLPERNRKGDLPADGGEPGGAFREQMRKLASGDRDTILSTLSAEQREFFDQMSADEQKEALDGVTEFLPMDVEVTGGALYDGYAIITFDAQQFGEPTKGRVLLIQQEGRWQVHEMSSTAG